MSGNIPIKSNLTPDTDPKSRVYFDVHLLRIINLQHQINHLPTITNDNFDLYVKLLKEFKLITLSNIIPSYDLRNYKHSYAYLQLHIFHIIIDAIMQSMSSKNIEQWISFKQELIEMRNNLLPIVHDISPPIRHIKFHIESYILMPFSE